MEVTNRKYGIRINFLFLLLSGIIILLSSVLIYLFVLRGVFGKFSVYDLIPTEQTIKSLFTGKKNDTAILYSEYTQNVLPKGSTWLVDNISTWKKFLSNLNVNYEVVDDKKIESDDLSSYKLIVLPGIKALSEKEIIKLKKYLESGGSIFATGGIASYSNDGKWKGWQFLNEVFGINFTKEISVNEIYKIHTLRGGLPLTANVPTGFPLKVATWDRPMAVEVLDPRATQVSFWYNYKAEYGLVREEIKKTAGIVYGNYGKGRFVWMGFEINSVIGSQDDYVYFEKLFNNSVNWLTYSPIGYVKDWPTGYNSAAIVSFIISEDSKNIDNVLPIIRRENIPVTFFADAEFAKSNPELIKKLSDYGEIASIIDIGYLTSVNDQINKLDSLELQIQKIAESKNTLEKISGRKVKGVIPLYGLFDQNTITAGIKNELKYLITDSLTDRSVPKTIIRGKNRILTITKTARDDYEVVRDLGLTQPEFQFYTYQEDIDRILFEGGLYVLKLHTDYQLKKEFVQVVSDLIAELKSKNFWIASASDIQSWYEKKDYVEIKTEKRGNSRVAIKVSNPGNEMINNLVIDIDLNEKVKNLTLDSEIIGTRPASIKHNDGSQMLYLYIDKLDAGESRIYFIDYDRVTS
ncbi:MAG: beta-galactosidase trimerization domain-containing protein [Ignavibacterium sp.]|uniref:polysaccharide deacetylase family protein n=1 Tax=Ignavibacterium sp. TaxID=2651167 RepID=UPI003298064A